MVFFINKNMKDIKNKRIILASNSPRRKEILEKEGIVFDVYVPKGVEYDIVGKPYSKDLVNECAKRKAENAYNEIKKKDNIDELIIVTCDTVVVKDNIIIGKPKDRNEAQDILKSLSGKEHIVSSSICIMTDDRWLVDNEETKVCFRELSEEDISSYIDRCRPFDKAGSYGIQDEGFDFVVKIDGNIDNVIGFPKEIFYKMLKMIEENNYDK